MSTQANPLVTVYITNHNYGRFLEKAILSVLAQTLAQYELIIIDDGSTDNSRDIIKRYEEHDRVVVVYQYNKGLNVSNNIALRMARGRYIMRLDADDYLDENALSILAGVLDRSHNVGMVFPDYYIVDESGTVVNVVRRHDFKDVEMYDQPAHGACTMIRKQCLLELGGYDLSYRCQDGYDIWIRFIEHYKVHNVNLPLFYYRQHSENSTKNEARILETRAKIIERHASHSHLRSNAVAVVPIRGKSTDRQSMALRKLGPKRLIDWTLRAALESKRLSGVIVSTPDDEIINYVSDEYRQDIVTVRRERSLALPNTYIEDTVFHALKEYAKNRTLPDAVVILYIESPFRSHKIIDSAVDVMELYDTDSVIAVRPETDVFYRHDGKGLKSLRNSELLRLEREELFRHVGHINVVRRSYLEEHRRVIGGRIGHVVVNQHESLSVRTEWDWNIAEYITNNVCETVLGEGGGAR